MTQEKSSAHFTFFRTREQIEFANRRVAEREEQVESLWDLVDQGLGFKGIWEEHDTAEIIMVVEEGMPDEFKEILATAVTGIPVSFRESSEQPENKPLIGLI